MTKTILLAFLAVALVTAVAAYRSLAGFRARRRTAWELERAEWLLRVEAASTPRPKGRGTPLAS